MAGARLGKAQRGSFTAAGYVRDADVQEMENDLYISKYPAGSKQDLLKDENRIGYSGAAFNEEEIPFAFFAQEEEQQRKQLKKQQATERRAREEEQRGFGERLQRAMRRERAAVMVCALMMVINLTLLAAWGQTMVKGVDKQGRIINYQDDIAQLDVQIEQVEMAIEEAKKPSTIRELATGMGMLRKGLEQSETIYIQTNMGQSAVSVAQEDAQQERGLLDWLLSVADILDFLI